MDEARRAGWDASGIDISSAMMEWARSELGVPVECGSFTRAEVPSPRLDAITMWDYIEHSIDPRSDLEKALKCLEPGGVLALSTGDVGTLSARLAGKRWHLLTPEHHNFFFDEKTLRRLLAETGFDVLEARHRASLYSLAHVFLQIGNLRPVQQRTSCGLPPRPVQARFDRGPAQPPGHRDRPRAAAAVIELRERARGGCARA